MIKQKLAHWNRTYQRNRGGRAQEKTQETDSAQEKGKKQKTLRNPIKNNN